MFGSEPHGIFVIIDPMVGQPAGTPERAQLRCIPLLQRLGINSFTFIDTWMQYQLVPFKFLRLGKTLPSDTEYPLAQIISQEVEETSDWDLTRRLLAKSFSGTKLLFVIVLDSERFMTRSLQEAKPMIEDMDLTDKVYSYEGLLSSYLRLCGLPSPPIPFHQTGNLLFQEMALEYSQITKKRPRRLSDLFDYSVIPATSAAWDFLESFADKRTREEFENHIHNSLRSWVETDITRISDKMLSVLQRCDFDRATIEQLRMKSNSVGRNE